MKEHPEDKGSKPLSASFITGAIALAFLVAGYQTALFMHRAAVLRIVANADCPDTVYIRADDAGPDGRYAGCDVYAGASVGENDSSRGRASDSDDAERVVSDDARSGGRSGKGGKSGGGTVHTGRTPYGERRNAPHAPAAQAVRESYLPRSYESFRFNPNTVSVADLQRLGFSRKQAEAIDNYRRKGGRFRRKEDFAKSYVVADSVFDRLAPFIDIPLLDLNAADSAAFDALPGIGPYYAARMAAYREELGGYSYKEQLMDIRGFDAERFAGLQDLVTVGPSKPYPLWTVTEDSLARHPYIDRRAAHGIVLYRDNNPRAEWTVEKIGKAGILSADLAEKLSRCRIAEP